MKKKTIEKIPYLGANMVRGHEGLVVRAARREIKGEKHLFVEIYDNTPGALATPIIRAVYTETDWGMYWPETDVWTAGGILSASERDGRLRWDCMRKTAVSEYDKGTIKEALGQTFDREVWGMLEIKERQIQSRRRDREDARRQQALKERQENTPPLPEDLRSWAAGHLFSGFKYLYYKKLGRKRARVTCSECGKTFEGRYTSPETLEGVGEPRIYDLQDGHAGVCRYCDAVGIYRPEGRSKGVYGVTKHVFVGQRYKQSGYVMRYVAVEKFMQVGEAAQVTLKELVRLYIRPDGTVAKDFHMDGYLTEMYWQDCNASFYQGKSIIVKEAEIYPGSFEEMKGTGVQYSALNEYRIRKGKLINAIAYLEAYAYWKAVEMMTKLGLMGIVDRVVNKEWYSIKINTAEKDPAKALGIRKDRLKMLIEGGGKPSDLELMQLEAKGKRWPDETMAFLRQKFIRAEAMEEILRYVPIEKAVNYLKKETGEWDTAPNIQHKATIYKDYLHMRRQLGYDMTNTVFLFPRNLEEKHNELTEELNAERTKEKEKIKEKEFAKIRRRYSDLLGQYGYEDGEYIIRPAMSASEIMKEGRLQHHCVGGDAYLKKHNDGQSFILLMRRKDHETLPYITVEISAEEPRIMQWYGAYDKKPDKEMVEEWLDGYISHLKEMTQPVMMYGA